MWTRRYGTTRTVLLTKRWAIKWPSFVERRLFLLGLLANMQELKFSRLAKTSNWPLCPVTFSIPGGWLIVMRRATPLTLEEFLEFSAKGGFDMDEAIVPVEMKMDSFGWLDGKIVAVDYGN